PWVTRQYVADSLDMGDIKSSMDVSLEVARRELLPGSVEVVPPEKAPVKQVVLTGDNADLRTLPIPMHQKDDAGAYLTMTCAMKGLTRDFYDITFKKNKFYEPRLMSFPAPKHNHLKAMPCEYEAENKRAPVIVILGHHPAFYFPPCCMPPMGKNDYLTAS